MKPGSARWWRELGLEPPLELAAEEPPAQRSLTSVSAQPLPEQAIPERPLPKRPMAERPVPERSVPERSVAGTRPPPPARPQPGARAAAPRATQPAAPVAAVDPLRAGQIAGLSWDELPAAIEACSACGLRRARTLSVPGVGSPGARWMFVGEGPGAEEDARGEPFVGAAGKLLDNMLAALGVARGPQVCIANVVKCRPPGNRTPDVAECAACLPFLERQIALVRPGVIVALGRVAAQALLASEMNVGSLRGKVHRYQDLPLVVTYHPAYLLRNLPEKARAWADLCLAQRVLGGTYE